ncbi:hypothetical protein [Streptomyces sp. NPDC059788]
MTWLLLIGSILSKTAATLSLRTKVMGTGIGLIIVGVLFIELGAAH